MAGSENKDASFQFSFGRGGHYGQRGGRGNFRGGTGQGGRRGRGGFLGTGRGARSRTFSIETLTGVENTDEVTVTLNSQMDGFSNFLAAEFMSSGDIVSTLEVLSRVLQNDLQREIVRKVLQAVCTSRFLDTHLTALIIQNMSSFPDTEVVEVVGLLHQLLFQVCRRLPSYSSKCYLLLTALTTMQNVVRTLEENKPTLAEGVRELLGECQQMMKMVLEGGKKKHSPASEDDQLPPEDFDQLPIFPSARDMDWNEKLFLRANKEEGSFRDANHYLDVHFRLMREDCIRPLREGIREYKNLKSSGENVSKLRDVWLYQGVQIVSMACKESVEHRVRFDNSRLKRVRWQSSKKLIFGSLLCLSRDDFDTFMFAVVTNRSTEDLEMGIIQIRFEADIGELFDIPPSATFTMLESIAYFEANRHVLEGLKEMKDSLPMSRYLVDCNPAIRTPKYVLNPMNLTTLLKAGSRHAASAVTVVNPAGWPPLEETELNQSQMEAVRTALTKELAIIQGPPGTGKTYVGLKVAKILLENEHLWTDPEEEEDGKPILVVCYTNHALDQFLEGILSFCPEGIVRVGGRSQSTALEQFNLKHIQNAQKHSKTETSEGLYLSNSKRECWKNLGQLRERIEAVSAKLEASGQVIVSMAVLKPFMPEGHFDSLTRNVHHFSTGQTNIIQWLSNGVLTGSEQEESDPHAALVEKVTSKIIQGKEVCNDNTINFNKVHHLSPAERARLYRFWLKKVLAALQRDHSSAASRGHNSQESLMWQDSARREILPDVLLQGVMSRDVYNAIITPLTQVHHEQRHHCVRAWLGLPEGAMPEMTSGISVDIFIQGDTNINPDAANQVPSATRLELYKYWRMKAVKLVQQQPYLDQKVIKTILELAEHEVLPDNLLTGVMNPALFHAIKREMQRRHERQYYYLIRAWLGIDMIRQVPSELEKLLDGLDNDEDDMASGEKQMNVQEEADVMQQERLLDLDYDNSASQKRSNLELRLAMRELAEIPIASHPSTVEEVGSQSEESFSVPMYHKKKLRKKLMHLQSTRKPMSQQEAVQVVDLWNPDFTTENRTSLYLFWLQAYQKSLQQSIKSTARDYNVESQQLRELKLQEDKNILSKAKVIGMTTTGAARLRRVLKGVACPIIILEEAAEVLESHVVSSLHGKCQHLILIGDHQQLRPSPTVFELCRKYKLDLSLFERLVNNNLPHSTLAVQHRMRPEVARLVRHVYPDLQDHETTRGRPRIRGVKHDVFLFHHEVEETSNSETSSKSNQHEAELCMRLCRYLLQQGYSPDTITILAAYSGQVFAFRNLIKDDPEFFQGVRVTAVDNYQGEENDIIILSLVRSNQEGSVGFLGTDNRVCVALSRARNGFFAFGNFRILADKSKLWKSICKTAGEHNQLGDQFVLRCENHPDKEIKVTKAKDFDEAPEGGCKQPCATRLSCGHACTLVCHAYDREHLKYKCGKKCERKTCKQGHPCDKKCYKDCDDCQYPVEKTLPLCGHKATMECSREPLTWTCKEPCQGMLSCGHKCSGQCGVCLKEKHHILKCSEEVEKVWPCGHLVKSACHTPQGELPCKHPCDASLDCGHQCPGTCGQCWGGRVHVTCKKKCGRVLPGCGHGCQLPCGTVCLPCKSKCQTTCRHSSCDQSCGMPCKPCHEPCPWKTCPHQECQSLCHKPCKPCPKPCGKKLKCGAEDAEEGNHVCSSFCGERCVCRVCDLKNVVPLSRDGFVLQEENKVVDEHSKLIKLGCGHVFGVAALDSYALKACQSVSPCSVLVCPVDSCRRKVVESDCWRYAALLRDRNKRLQKAQRELIRKSYVSDKRRQKVCDSVTMLTHNAEKEKSFASKAVLGNIFKHKTLDVNFAFALTNQIKLTRVFEQLSTVLESDPRDAFDLKFLQKLLFKPVSFMTKQRLRELALATRRLAYIAKLTRFAPVSSLREEFMQKVDSCLQSLREDGTVQPNVQTEAERILTEAEQNKYGRFGHLCEKVDFSILNAPCDQDLCDVGKPLTQSEEDSPKTASTPVILALSAPALRAKDATASGEKKPPKAFISSETLQILEDKRNEPPEISAKTARSPRPALRDASDGNTSLESTLSSPQGNDDNLSENVPDEADVVKSPEAPSSMMQQHANPSENEKEKSAETAPGTIKDQIPKSSTTTEDAVGSGSSAPGSGSTGRLQYSKKELCDLNHTSLPSPQVRELINAFNISVTPGQPAVSSSNQQKARVSSNQPNTGASSNEPNTSAASNTQQPGPISGDALSKARVLARKILLVSQDQNKQPKSSTFLRTSRTPKHDLPKPSLAEAPSRGREKTESTGAGLSSQTQSSPVDRVATELEQHKEDAAFASAITSARAVASRMSMHN
ncbi:NFX1-type zinc finger-containing protein 1-like [Littorina saxatilis]|uniref:NFX1-type zinc finger-containing protein 1 n=1 Tax=Littorina saxatilis TaxID=31220 RepID=A0AAN9BYQ1_9CAEN